MKSHSLTFISKLRNRYLNLKFKFFDYSKLLGRGRKHGNKALIKAKKNNFRPFFWKKRFNKFKKPSKRGSIIYRLRFFKPFFKPIFLYRFWLRKRIGQNKVAFKKIKNLLNVSFLCRIVSLVNFGHLLRFILGKPKLLYTYILFCKPNFKYKLYKMQRLSGKTHPTFARSILEDFFFYRNEKLVNKKQRIIRVSRFPYRKQKP